MAAGTEIERLLVRLVGDATSYQRMLKTSEAATKRTMVSIRRMGFQMEAVGRSITKVGRSMQSLGRSMALRVTAPLAAIGLLGVKAFANFDNAMIQSTSIMGDLTDDTKELMRTTALGLSAKVAQSPKELAESYFFLASAGKTAAQSMALLPQVAQFATAGAFDMALATDLLTDAQSALGLSSKNIVRDTENMTRVADVLVKANTLANASVQQFATALTSKAGAALKVYNKDVEEGVAVLAAMADQGIKAELAGNALDRIIRLLSKAQLDNTDALKKYNVELFDASGSMRNMGDIVADLEVAFKDMSDIERAAALDAMGFEARVQGVILPLLGTSKAIKQYEKELRNAGGTTKEVSEKQMKSFTNQMKKLWNQIVTVGIEIGEVLAPFILKLNVQIERAVKFWKDLSPEIKRTAVLIGAIVAVIGPLLIAMGGLTAVSGFLITMGGAIIGFFMSWTPLIIAAVIGVGALITTVLAFIVPWRKVFDTVKLFFVSAIGFIVNFKENLTSLWSWLKDNWKTILTDMFNLWVLSFINMIANMRVFVETIGRLWVLLTGFGASRLDQLFTVDFVVFVVEGIAKAARKMAEFSIFIVRKMKAAFAGQSFSLADFLLQISEDFTSGRNAKTLAEVGTEAGEIINEQLAKTVNPFAGFESGLVGGSDFNFALPESSKKEIEEAGKEAGEDFSAGVAAALSDASGPAVKEVSEAMKKLFQRGTELTEQFLLPEEAFVKKAKELQSLLAVGAIDLPTFNRARAAIEKDFQELKKEAIIQIKILGPRDAVGIGSAEAARRLAEFREATAFIKPVLAKLPDVPAPNVFGPEVPLPPRPARSVILEALQDPFTPMIPQRTLDEPLGGPFGGVPQAVLNEKLERMVVGIEDLVALGEGEAEKTEDLTTADLE